MRGAVGLSSSWTDDAERFHRRVVSRHPLTTPTVVARTRKYRGAQITGGAAKPNVDGVFEVFPCRDGADRRACGAGFTHPNCLRRTHNAGNGILQALPRWWTKSALSAQTLIKPKAYRDAATNLAHRYNCAEG